MWLIFIQIFDIGSFRACFPRGGRIFFILLVSAPLLLFACAESVTYLATGFDNGIVYLLSGALGTPGCSYYYYSRREVRLLPRRRWT